MKIEQYLTDLMDDWVVKDRERRVKGFDVNSTLSLLCPRDTSTSVSQVLGNMWR